MFTDNITAIISNGGMDWVAIATFVLAMVTGVLAFASFRAIRQNYNFRKEDRKERLLNKIIDWAIDVAKCEFTVNIQQPLPIFSRLYEKPFSEYEFKDKQELAKGIMLDYKRFWLNHYENLHLNYQALDIKGEHILSLCDAKYFASIINSVRTVKVQISDYQERLLEYMKDIDDESKRQNLENKAKELNASAVELIKEATKIQTGDII